MPALNATATQLYFRGLKCAYTGKPVTPKVVAYGGHRPRFFVPDAFDPSDPNPDMADLMTKFCTRDGVIGAVNEAGPLRCPYTGAPVTLRRSSAGFSLIGGFRPHALVSDPRRLAYDMRLRNGEAPAGSLPPGPPVVIQAEAREPAEKLSGPADTTDQAMEVVEGLVKKEYVPKTTVVAPGPVGRGRPRKAK